MANLVKSGVNPIACDQVDLDALLPNFSIPVLQFPCKYLGLPLHYMKITRAYLQPTLDKMVSRLQRWKGNYSLTALVSG